MNISSRLSSTYDTQKPVSTNSITVLFIYRYLPPPNRQPHLNAGFNFTKGKPCLTECLILFTEHKKAFICFAAKYTDEF